MHEALIDEDTFEIANEKLKSRKRPFKTGELSLFAGLIKCPDCGKSLNLARNNSKKKEKLFTCNTYRRCGKDFCSQHRIMYDEVYRVVLEDIRSNAKLALKDEKEVLKILELNQEEELDSQVVLAGQMIEEDSLRYKELETKVERLYDDWIDKRINETNFNRLMEKTQKEQDILLERIKVNEEKIKNSESKDINISKWIESIKKYQNIKKLDRHILNELIDKIFVYEKEIIDGEVVQTVEIFYNFLLNTKELNIIYHL